VSYALREALAAFRRVPVLTGLASAMVGLALFVVGLFTLAAFNLEEALREAESRVEVVAYLRDDVRNAELDLAHRELARLPEVQEVHFVSKAMALESIRRDLPDLEGVFANLAVNPLPASFEIRLRPGFRTRESVEEVSGLVAAYPFVEDVTYGQEWVERLFALRRVAGVTVAVMGAAFAVVAALIIGTALKIAVFARREEIYIMRLVGARDGFIRLPFLLEGAMAGLLGGLFAALLTYLTFRALYSLLFQLSWIPGAWVLTGVVAGGVFGVVASGFSVRRHLREV
jgi:cell division transport system permease protein